MRFPISAARSAPAVVVCCGVLLGMSGCRGGVSGWIARMHLRRATSPFNTAYAGKVERLVGSPSLPGLRWPNYADDRPAVQKFYRDRDDELAWTRGGQPTGATMALLHLFQNAQQKGLNPRDYDANAAGEGRWAPRLQRLAVIAKIRDDGPAAQDEVARFDVAMTISAMRYLEDLHLGRINPQALGFDIDVPKRRAAFDVATLLNDRVVDAADVPAVVESVEPVNPMYKQTEQALEVYRTLAMEQAAAPALPLPALPVGAQPVGVGGWYSATPRLWARLQLEGDAPPPDAGPSPASHPVPRRYDLDVAMAVKRYQERHELEPDGRLGQATIESLNVPMSLRVRQLDDALERWRWLPDNYVQPRVLVNLPEFMLRAYNPDHTLAFKMKVVIGQAKDGHDTPMFVRLMRYVVFRPYWNLPPDIIRKDLVPHVEKSGLGYLAAHNYQVYKNDGTVVTKFTLHDLEHLRYNVRQLPGPNNSLGLVLFLFPNIYDVYLHSTPALSLFGLTRRDKSHGCVRLRHADQMALWVMQGDQKDPDEQNGWDTDKIDLATTGPLNNYTVRLRTPLPVVIGYFTALPNEDGMIHFFDDLYGYDQDLETALATGRPYERAERKILPAPSR